MQHFKYENRIMQLETMIKRLHITKIKTDNTH